MACPVIKLPRGKHVAHLMLYISIKVAKPRKKPVTSRKIRKKQPKKKKPTSREERKKNKGMAKNHRVKHPKQKTSGPAREVRKRRRRQQSKRVSFATVNKPLPAFFLFMAQYRPQLQASCPGWTAVHIVKKLAKAWHQQPEEDKEMYKQQAAQLRRKMQRSGRGPGTARKKKISKRKEEMKTSDGLLG